MTLEIIPFKNLIVPTHRLWNNQWLLLAAGDFAAGAYNAMTVGWGSLGTLWNKPCAQIFVRPSRHTFGFLEKYDTFTLSAFPADCHDALNLLGTKSGRDGDKILASGLTPQAAAVVKAPSFAQAELVIECKKIYWQDLDPAHFLDPQTEKNYPQKDYHRIYFGEILTVSGIDAYRAA